VSTHKLRTTDAAVGTIGAILGLVFGAVIVIYLDRHQVPTPPPAPSTHARQVITPRTDTALHELATRQAAEIARLKLAVDVDHVLNLLRRSKPSLDPARPEVVTLARLPFKELHDEIKLAATDVANYASEDTYAPEQHATLYHRVNTLWDIRGLSDDENAWLAEAVKILDELAVRHAEESLRDGDNEAVVRVALSLGDWTFRLNHDQKKRLTSVLRATETRLRSGG
jgi:hypothetical protein